MHHRTIVQLATLLLLFATPWSARAGLVELSDLFVFGDSLSDGGNSGLLTQAYTGDPSVVFPPPPYYNGRSSNGPVAVEYLWNSFNPGRPFGPSLAGGTNFAIGGATSGTGNFNEVNPLVPTALQPAFAGHGNAWQLEQFQQYQSTHAPFDPSTTLFFVWLFPNDVFYTDATDSLPGVVTDSPGGTNLIENGIANILATVQTLAMLGAKNILVVNLPNLADTPAYRDTPLAPDLDLFSETYNAALAAQLDQLDALLAADVIQFDIDAAFQEILAHPANYGFTNTTDVCVENLQNGLCDPGSWVFWDSVHPTTRTHQVLAGFLARQLQVPEPAALALFIIGVLCVGIARWRRHP